MGMYTELHFNSALKKDVPIEVVEVLLFMIGQSSDEPQLPDHQLFKTARWSFMLTCDSYYFDADTVSTLRFDDISDCYYLCIRCNLKNYNQEIEKFVSWIMPYLDKYPGEFLGFKRYEEHDEPTLLFMSMWGGSWEC